MDLESALGYSFKDKQLLKIALTHSSYQHENPNDGLPCNERLEFLGDTVLGLVVSAELYAIEPPLSEAEMAKMKSYLVSGRILSQIANSIGLGRHIRLGKGEIGTGGRAKTSILADAMESLFGAVFLDGGFDRARETIRVLYLSVMRAALDGMQYLDYKTELQELCQNLFGALPQYAVIHEEGLQHEKMFTVKVSIGDQVLGFGTGKSKKNAEIDAARDAYLKMRSRLDNHDGKSKVSSCAGEASSRGRTPS